MRILGISAFYHDSAAAIVEDGKVVAAAQEERFSRIKHDDRFPLHAIRSCLEQARCDLRGIDYVAFFEKPFLKFERLLETYLAIAPQGFPSFQRALPLWIKEKLFQKSMLLEMLSSISDGMTEAKLLFAEHHQSHAASAFFPSPFPEAAVITADGVGEWATTSLGYGRGNQLDILKEIHFPHSLGLLYSAFTYYTGFKVNSGEYKVMGLAPYGDPKYRDLILNNLIDLKEDGSFRLDMRYFNYCGGLTMTNRRFDALFGGPPRHPDTDMLEQRHMDLAASIQWVCEEAMLRLARFAAKETDAENLCLAGGVALNCVANGKILRDGCFKNIWIQPAAGDAGGSLGAALAAFHQHLGNERKPHTGYDAMQGSYLGPSFDDGEIEQRLKAEGANYEILDEPALIDTVSTALAEGMAVGWFQGRMEFGPRALGNRSILGDPRSPGMQKQLNLKVKYRESFRPFAPAVLAEDVTEWFELVERSPYMLVVATVQPWHCLPESHDQKRLFGIERLNLSRSDIPAVTHVDYSARIQTVHQDTNPRFHALIAAFKSKTGCPVLVNTSFNVRGEPIVGSPEDAFRCFMGTELDMLAIGNCLLHKERQSPSLKRNYETAFDLD